MLATLHPTSMALVATRLHVLHRSRRALLFVALGTSEPLHYIFKAGIPTSDICERAGTASADMAALTL